MNIIMNSMSQHDSDKTFMDLNSHDFELSDSFIYRLSFCYFSEGKFGRIKFP